MSNYDRMLSSEERSQIGQACDVIQKTTQSVYMPPMAVLEALYNALQVGTDLQCSEGDFISSEQVIAWLESAKQAVQEAQAYISFKPNTSLAIAS
jgi:hypothetical protein